MTNVAKVTQEIIDWANSHRYFDDYNDYNPGEKFEYLDRAMPLFVDYGNKIELPSGIVSHVDEYGGEDMGSQRWIVFRVGEDYFQVDGYYNSWDGDNWDSAELVEVVPVERTVTQFIRK